MSEENQPKERNSEGTFTKVMGVIGFVIAGLAGAVEGLSEAGLEQHWPAFATVVTIFGFVSKLAWEYTRARPAKHQAIAIEAEAKSRGNS